MLILAIHVLLAVFYLFQFPSNIFLIGIFYLSFLIPPLHKNIVYYILEFKIPPWSFALKCLIHTCLYHDMVKKVHVVVWWMLVYLWSDLWYVVHHAEARLSKINDLLYNYPSRIAHLFYNIYDDDTVNRFHKHLFDTNRLYMFDKTPESDSISLEIMNYRKMNSFIPNKLSKAAQGKTIFIRDRSMLYLPALFLFVYTGFVDFNFHYKAAITWCIFFAESMRLVLSTPYLYVLTNLVVAFGVLLAMQIEIVFLITPINI